MHTYRILDYPSRSYSVGIFFTIGDDNRWKAEWLDIRRFPLDKEDDAIKFVNLLNGGPR
mgnify:FL=1